MKLLAALLVLTLPAWAATPPACSSLCGSWKLESTLSEAVTPVVDEALRSYSNPRAKRSRRGDTNDTLDMIDAEMERSLGPIHDRPSRAGLRTELITLLGAPAQLNLDVRGNDVFIQSDGLSSRRLTPGTPKARVDANGTAKISTLLKPDRLTVTERYDRKRTYSETYAVHRSDGTLLVTREVKRPGLKLLRILSVYRRA